MCWVCCEVSPLLTVPVKRPIWLFCFPEFWTLDINLLKPKFISSIVSGPGQTRLLSLGLAGRWLTNRPVSAPLNVTSWSCLHITSWEIIFFSLKFPWFCSLMLKQPKIVKLALGLFIYLWSNLEKLDLPFRFETLRHPWAILGFIYSGFFFQPRQ